MSGLILKLRLKTEVRLRDEARRSDPQWRTPRLRSLEPMATTVTWEADVVLVGAIEFEACCMSHMYMNV